MTGVRKVSESRVLEGDRYEGTWDAIGIDGIGKYVTARKLRYEGQFREGTFHGAGSIRWPAGQRMDGLWLAGQLMTKRYVFADELVYEENEWAYCKFPDRRFHKCITYGLRPAGNTLKTDQLPTRFIPRQRYDVTYGMFEPSVRCVTSYENSKRILRIPTTVEAEWIKENCRKGWTEPSGHVPHFYENWFPTVQQTRISIIGDAALIPEGISENWWKRLTTFDRCYPEILLPGPGDGT